jgi:selenide,water dikinase
MAKFHDLPAMPAPDRPEPPGGPPGRPLCAGCGAKVGRGALQAALSGLSAPARADVETGAGDDAAVLRVGGARQVITTDHLRAFTSDPWLMARIAAVHALGDVWSMGAAPQAALAQVILPPMGERQQAETLREIMDAAAGIFGPEGAEIVGGHTSLGAEFTLGFTVTGLCAGPAITHRGARAGDRLILTKPIGTGVILAAEMAGRAAGRWVAAAYDSMARPSGAAARLLAPHARAMTDVTGFGLAGHLLTILEASQVAVRLDLAAVPTLAGTVELARAGEGSSLLPANRQAAARMTFTEGPDAELLFDPQTAGGLLAAVPADVAQAVLADLRAAGEPAAIIGEVIAGEPGIVVEA